MRLEVRQTRPCGPCAMCCKTHEVIRDDGSAKPKHSWCENAVDNGNGKCCGDHANRWRSCNEFVCLWAGGVLPEHMSPMATRCVLTAVEDYLLVAESVPLAHRRGKMPDLLNHMIDSGVKVVVESAMGLIVYDMNEERQAFETTTGRIKAFKTKVERL